MRLVKRSAFRTGVLVLMGLCLGVAKSPASDPMEKALPSSTIAYLKVENLSQMKEAFQASQMGRLWADPAMKPLRDKLATSIEEHNTKLKEALGVSLEELLDLPQGEIGIAIVSKDDPKIPVALLVGIDAGDKAGQLAEVMAKVDKMAESSGAKIATEQNEQITLHVIRVEDETAPPLVWTQAGSMFYVASDIEALKDLLAHAKGRDSSMASSENYTQILKKVGTDAHLTWYLDINQLVHVFIQAASENGGANAEQLATQVQLTGLNGLKAVGGTFSLNQGDFDSVYKAFFYAPAPHQGVLKLFSMPATELKPESWVPANIASYSTYSWEIDKFWGGLTELVDQFAPGVLEQAERELGGPDGNGLDIKKSIFGPLGKRVSMISDYKKPVTDASQRIVFAVSLSDAKTAQATLNKILDLAKASPKQRSFQGNTIYDFDLPAEAAGSGITGPISLAIANDHLFVSVEPTLLEQVLRGGGQSLAETSAYQEAIKHVPSRVSMWSFDRPEDQVQVLYGLFNNDQVKAALEQARSQNPNTPKLEEFLDPKLLPDYKEVQKYLSPSGSYGITSEEGMFFTGFTIKKLQ